MSSRKLGKTFSPQPLLNFWVGFEKSQRKKEQAAAHANLYSAAELPIIEAEPQTTTITTTTTTTGMRTLDISRYLDGQYGGP